MPITFRLDVSYEGKENKENGKSCSRSTFVEKKSMIQSCRSILQKFGASIRLEEYDFLDPGKTPFLMDIEEQLANSLSSFELLDEQAWATLRQKVNLELAAKLLTFGLRMATVAVRRSRQSYIQAGAMGLVLDNDLLDTRDVYRVLGVLYDAGFRIKADAERIFRNVARFAAPLRSGIFREGFFDMPNCKTLRSIGMKAIETTEGLLYRPVSF